MGHSLKLMKKYKEAIAAFKMVFKDNSDNVLYLCHLSSALLGNGQIQ